MPKLGRLPCSSYRGTKIIIFPSVTSIRLHEKFQTQVTLQLVVCASWRRFPPPETHDLTSVNTESDRLFLKKRESVLEFVKSKFNPHLRNDAFRNQHRMKLDSVLKSSLLIMHRQTVAFHQVHTKDTNTLCGQNVEFLNGKLAVRKLTTGL
jgi:hypothetical protein